MRNIFKDYKTKKQRIEQQEFFILTWWDVFYLTIFALAIANMIVYLT